MKEYVVTFRVKAYWEKCIRADSIEDAKKIAEETFSEAEIGDFYNVDGEVTGIVESSLKTANSASEKAATAKTVPCVPDSAETHLAYAEEDDGYTIDTVQYAYDFARHQTEEGLADVGFFYKDTFITNPWLDPDGIHHLVHSEAIATYGKDNIVRFVHEANERGKKL